jgi:hypothetical protein
MINSNAPYSGLANIMNMRDRNPNTQLAYVPNGYLNSVPSAPNPYTGIPQVNSPIAMNEGGMPSMQYPMQEEAGQLADRGRYGDTTLVHMTPGEVQGLASLGQLTINPDTGLPEAFNMGSILPIIANVGLAMATGGMSLPAQMAIMGAANFGMGLAQGQSTGQALIGGLTSAATTGIFSGLGSSLSNAAGKSAEQAAKEAAQTSLIEGALASENALAAWSPAWDVGVGTMGTSGAPLVSSVPNVVDPLVTAAKAGTLTPAQAGLEGFGANNAFFTPDGPGITLTESVKPNWFQKNILGETAEYAKGDFVPLSEFKGKGLFGGDIAYQDMGLKERIAANITNPVSYAPIVTGAATGAFNNPPYKYEDPEARDQ